VKDTTPQAVQACHELILWLISQLDKFPRSRRFTVLVGELRGKCVTSSEACFWMCTSSRHAAIGLCAILFSKAWILFKVDFQLMRNPIIKLTVLGSGTCVPSVRRSAPGYLLEVSGRQILVECGNGTLRQLESSGKGYKEIDAILITHTHPDHFSDLTAILHALMATPGFTRERGLSIIGPRGFERIYECCITSILRKPGTFTVEVREAEGKMDLGYIHVLTAKTIHSGNSIAYRFECEGRSIVITGDCDYDEGVVSLSMNADLLVIDCSFPSALKVSGHLSAKECGMVARKAKVGKVLLSHIYPTHIPDDERLRECMAEYEGEVLLAEDLMEIQV
jgi:ribonuclease BN (tRNA processing enzyme)